MKALTYDDVKVGDWVVQGYEIKQVVSKSSEYESVDLSTGVIRSCGNFSGMMFPLTLDTKVIAYSVNHTMDQIRKIHRQLNFPDINRKMESFFVEGCSYDKDSKTYETDMSTFWDRVEKFKTDIRDKVENLKLDTVEGISIMR